MKKVALTVCKQFSCYHPCDRILAECLKKNGYEVSKQNWDDPDCKWEEFDLVILRSVCNYIDHIDEFLSWVDHVSSVTTLINSKKLILENYNKAYLKKMECKGIRIVHTDIAENTGDLISVINNIPYDKLVLKCALGAKGLRTYPFNKNQLSEVLETVKDFPISSRTPLLVQPYLVEIEEFGEVSAMYFNNKFSFAVRRKPLFKENGIMEDETIKVYEMSSSEKEFCDQVLAFYEEVSVYAKIDYVLLNGEPHLIKIGFIEPNLYFHSSPSNVQDFVDAIKERFGN